MKAAGADTVITANTETGSALAGGILASMGVNAGQLSMLGTALRQQMDGRAQSLVPEVGHEGSSRSSDDDVFRFDEGFLATVRGPGTQSHCLSENTVRVLRACCLCESVAAACGCVCAVEVRSFGGSVIDGSASREGVLYAECPEQAGRPADC